MILALKLAKCANASKNIVFFLQKFDMGIINTKFYAEFESVEKSAKQFTPEKL